MGNVSLNFDLGYILKWFNVNSLKSNPSKFQFMILETHFDLRVNQFLDRNRIEKSQEVVLLGITIDDKLSVRNAY